MKERTLGEFEEVVLLTVGVLFDEAYGVAIKDEIESRLSRKVSVGAMQTALRRLEQKGYLSSRQGEANRTRGGKPKRFFTITSEGARALEQARDVRNELWNAIPKVALELKFT